MKKLLSLLLLVSFTLFAANYDKQLERKFKLPENFKENLSAEMFDLQSKMNQVLEGISRGKWQMLQSVADEMSQNYILKQKMSYQDKKYLKRYLPKGFIALDRYFHELAGEMAQAAKKKDAKVVLEKYQGMIKSCMECHAQYADYRFTEFKGFEIKNTIPKKFYKLPDEWR
ncbi:MAG: hypothetical protein DRQ88_11930 [Epsilonproteobacteria bacterium]|nr:MAG: hypothetical protein DRQ88_11930 [Campylobacterota bacterium]RLA65797.1 MAG: hypothetical protein DRQ89_00135 [Campylobacterota bacterium]